MIPLKLVIGGAPKCGTSSLFRWLEAHPQLQGSSPKETFYFIEPHLPLAKPGGNFATDGWAGYRKFFPGTNEGKHWFEGTTHYLYSESARKILSSMAEPPLMVFLIRKPEARILSSFNFTKNNLAALDSEVTFAEYTELLLEGKADQLAPRFHRGDSAYVLPRDLENSRYLEHLRKWREAVGEDKVKVLLFEQMRTEPGHAITRLCNSIGVDADVYKSFNFSASNETISVKNPALHRLARKWGQLLPSSVLKKLLKTLYFKGQSAPPPKQDERISLARLEEYFRPWNEKLESEFGVDISLWRGAEKR